LSAVVQSTWRNPQALDRGPLVEGVRGDPERARRLAPSIPMERAGSADEVAAAVLRLLSDAASYTTGAIVDARVAARLGVMHRFRSWAATVLRQNG